MQPELGMFTIKFWKIYFGDFRMRSNSRQWNIRNSMGSHELEIGTGVLTLDRGMD